ncbi:MAG: DUF359 domain-containing protein [Nitrososphaerota archaeon]
MEGVIWPPRRKIIFTEEMKNRLREPIGELVTGRDPDEVTRRLKQLIEDIKPPVVIAVGDYVSNKLYQHNIKVDIYVVDGRIERIEKPIHLTTLENVVESVNEAGTISPSSAEKLHQLIHSPESWPIVLKVKGEEDLLALAAILSSPENSVIVYGQPKKGAVLVRVNDQVRNKMVEIIRQSGITS